MRNAGFCRNLVLEPISGENIAPQSFLGLPWWLSNKESTCNVADLGSVPGAGRFPLRRKWQPTSVFCQRRPMDRGTWQAIAHAVTKSRTRLINPPPGRLSQRCHLCLWRRRVLSAFPDYYKPQDRRKAKVSPRLSF